MSEFEELVDSHYKALYRFGYSLSKSADLASDLVQQTFTIWAEKGHQLKDRSKAKTWLFTTLYREFLGQNKKSKRFINEDTSNLEFALPAAEHNGARQMDSQRAVQILSELEDIFRAPLTLFYLQQHSYKEIAQILEVPIGTVMSRISRGKSLLKKNFFDGEEDGDGKIIKLERKEAKNG